MQSLWRAALVVAVAALPAVTTARLRPAGPEFDLPPGSDSRHGGADGYGSFYVVTGGGWRATLHGNRTAGTFTVPAAPKADWRACGPH